MAFFFWLFCVVQEKITETTAQQQKSAIELAVERVRREAKNQEERVQKKVIKNDELADKREFALEDAIKVMQL